TGDDGTRQPGACQSLSLGLVAHPDDEAPGSGDEANQQYQTDVLAADLAYRDALASAEFVYAAATAAAGGTARDADAAASETRTREQQAAADAYEVAIGEANPTDMAAERRAHEDRVRQAADAYNAARDAAWAAYNNAVADASEALGAREQQIWQAYSDAVEA